MNLVISYDAPTGEQQAEKHFGAKSRAIGCACGRCEKYSKNREHELGDRARCHHEHELGFEPNDLGNSNTTETDKHGELFTSTRAVLASADPELSAARSPKTRNDKLFSCVLPRDLRSDGDDLLEDPCSFKINYGVSLFIVAFYN